MQKANRVLLAAVSSIVLYSVVLYGQDSHARIVRVSYLMGTVQINNQIVSLNVPLIQGNVLTTGTMSFAEVEFEDHSRLRLGPDTQVVFKELARSNSGEALTRLEIEGEAELTTGEHVQQQFTLIAAHKDIRMAKSGRVRVLATQADPLQVAVWKGEVIVHDADSAEDVTVAKGETFTLAGDLQQYVVEKGNETDQLDHFSKLRDQYLDGEYVTVNNTAVVNTSLFTFFGFAPCSPYYFTPSFLQGCFSPFSFYPYPTGYGYAGNYYYVPPYHHRRFPPIHPPTPAALVEGRNTRLSGKLQNLPDIDRHGVISRSKGNDFRHSKNESSLQQQHSGSAGTAARAVHSNSAAPGFSMSHGYSGASGASAHTSGFSSSSGFSGHTASAASSSSGGSSAGSSGRSH